MISRFEGGFFVRSNTVLLPSPTNSSILLSLASNVGMELEITVPKNMSVDKGADWKTTVLESLIA